MLNARITQKPWTPDKVMKNINFGLARGLTRTAKDGQSAVLRSLHGNFQIRNRWPEIGPLSIQVKSATPRDLSAEVRSRADFLLPHEEGKAKTAQTGRHVVVPTHHVRRNKRMIIPRGQRPRGLGGKAFILETKNGPVLAQRITRGKRKGVIILYGMEQKVRIKKVSTFYEPLEKVVSRRGRRHLNDSVQDALRTMR